MSLTTETAGKRKRAFQRIPGVGPNMARHLEQLGYADIGDLKGESPERMYERDRLLHGGTLDRCVLYVYRLAVRFAENGGQDMPPEQMKWWNWKERGN